MLERVLLSLPVADKLNVRLAVASLTGAGGSTLDITARGNTLIVLLCGGDKRTQGRDIRRAIDMAKEV